MLKAVPSCLAVALVAAPAWAQFPAVGPEFQANTYTTGSQYDQSVAVDAAGNFVVVWRGNQNDTGDIFGRRFNAAGAPIGNEFLVNSNVGGPQVTPAIAMAPTGAFVVLWDGFDSSAGAIKGQRYDALGNPAGPEFQVNTYTPGSQYWSSVATDASGNFVVVWTGGGQQDGSASGIFGQRFSAAGLALGAEFRVNSYTGGYQTAPDVATDADGNFVVVWQSIGQDGDWFGIFGQQFSSTGAAVGPEFQVNTTTAGWQRYPAVASDAAGRFVVVWEGPIGVSGLGIFGRHFEASGFPSGGEYPLSNYSNGFQTSAAVARDSGGHFVVTWASSAGDGAGQGVFARLFDPNTSPLGTEFRVNTFTTGNQARPAVAFGRHGDVVIAWESWGQDAPVTSGVFGQVYSDRIFGDGFEP